jgi:PcfJ-like protein
MLTHQRQGCSVRNSATAMGNFKKKHPHQWEITHEKYRAYCTKPKAPKGDASSIHHLDKMENLPFEETFQNKGYLHNSLYSFPIQRFLNRQVGRDYDEVYSELLQRIPERYRKAINKEDFCLTKHKRSKMLHKGFELGYSFRNPKLFVALENNIICRHPAPNGKKPNKEIFDKPVFRPFKQSQFLIRHQTYRKVSFQQLSTYPAFVQEAKAMKHCVRSYWRSCVSEIYKTSIWSMEIDAVKTLTIQISDGQITQVRGVQNRLPTIAEAILIKIWANQITCKISDSAIVRLLELTKV